MKDIIPILSVTGSDCSGAAGIQADVKTVTDMGGYPLTAVTALTVQNSSRIVDVHPMPSSVVAKQINTVIEDLHPRVVKIGLLCNVEMVGVVRDEVIGCRDIVLDPGIISSRGERIMGDETMNAYFNLLVPEASLLMLRCCDAELMLGMQIHSDDDMMKAAEHFAEKGARWVLLRGGNHVEGKLTALLYGEGYKKFFVSYNTEGWRRHGVGSAFGAAIAVRIAMGDDMLHAISKAHEYIHSQVVYSVSEKVSNLRPSDLYNDFLSLISENYKSAHDVAFYADRLCITPRYLCIVTDKMVSKSPKEVITDYLMHEAKVLLDSTRCSVQEISDMLGFSSQPMFCRFFKRNEGCSPLEYRTNMG